jgi:hypothetical protein
MSAAQRMFYPISLSQQQGKTKTEKKNRILEQSSPAQFFSKVEPNFSTLNERIIPLQSPWLVKSRAGYMAPGIASPYILKNTRSQTFFIP